MDISHDDVIIWKHFLHYCHFARGIHRSVADSPHDGPLMFTCDVFSDISLEEQRVELPAIWDFMTPIWRHSDVEITSLIIMCYYSPEQLLSERLYYTPASTKLIGGYTGITLSVCPSVDRIVSSLYLQQYSSDPFHICTSYQPTSEGVSKKFWRIFKIFNFDLGSNMTQWYG